MYLPEFSIGRGINPLITLHSEQHFQGAFGSDHLYGYSMSVALVKQNAQSEVYWRPLGLGLRRLMKN